MSGLGRKERRALADTLVDVGERRTGRGGPHVRVVGPPSELVLFCFGRQRASRVELKGPDDLVQQILTAKTGI
jgi:hypothetical protein